MFMKQELRARMIRLCFVNAENARALGVKDAGFDEVVNGTAGAEGRIQLQKWLRP